jgi:protein-tyrosine phosphatase
MFLPSIRLQRIKADTLRISWQEMPGIDAVSISWSVSPEAEAEPAGSTLISNGSWTDIDRLDPTSRYYFTLSSNGRILGRIAERLVPFEGTFNFRDLGGYPAAGGRRVKWGRVFRSDNLSNLSARDHALFQQMRIKLVCDFRSPPERAKSPNKLPQDPAVQSLHLPMLLGTIDAVEAMERFKNKDLDWLTPDYMQDGYLKNLEHSADKWAAVFKRLLDDEPPLVFHCSAGKDRTGICAALILLALGVPRETVIHDHRLSNEYLQAFLPKVNSYFQSLGLDPRRIAPYLTAPEEAMLAVLDHLQERYGSIEAYLDHKAGITEQQIALLREKLLE